MSRKITNKIHSYVQKTLNEVIKIYNVSKTYIDKTNYIDLCPHELYLYRYHKQMIKVAEEVIRNLKCARATVCYSYGTYRNVDDYILNYVENSLTALNNINISDFLIGRIKHINKFNM